MSLCCFYHALTHVYLLTGSEHKRTRSDQRLRRHGATKCKSEVTGRGSQVYVLTSIKIFKKSWRSLYVFLRTACFQFELLELVHVLLF